MAVIGTFGSFTAARLGIYASQASLNVTGNNIANINTKGYTRQRMDLVSLYSGGADRYANKFSLNVGYGVLCSGVDQLRDPYLDIRFRNEQASLGEQEAKLNGLIDLSAVFDEVGKGDGQFGVIENQLNDFLSQLQILSRNVGSEEYDTLVRSSASSLAKLFNTAAKELDTQYDNTVAKLKSSVNDVNNILSRIQSLNEEIRSAGLHGDKALELRDTRNLLIDELSSYMKIDVVYTTEKIDQYSEVEKIMINLADTSPAVNLVDGVYVTQLMMPEEIPQPNPDYDPNDPAGMEYLDWDGRPTDNPREAAPMWNNNNLFYLDKDNKPTADKDQAFRTPNLGFNLKYLDATGNPTNDPDQAALEADGVTKKLNPSADKRWLDKDGNPTNNEEDAIVRNPDPTTSDKVPYLKWDPNEKVTADNLINNPGKKEGDQGAYVPVASSAEATLQENTKTPYDPKHEPGMKYISKDGVTPTDKLEDAATVPNIKEGEKDSNLYRIRLDALKDSKGRFRRDEHDRFIDDQVDIDDVTLKGSLQALRELLTEEGEFSSETDLKFDGKAASKRGYPYYEKALDFLASSFAKAFNEANQMDPAVIYEMEQYVDPNNPAWNKMGFKGSDGNFVRDADGRIMSPENNNVDAEVLRQAGVKLKKEYAYYDGGILFSNDGATDNTENITARNFSVSKSWGNSSVRLLSTTKPDTESTHTTANDNIDHMINLMGKKIPYDTTEVQGDAVKGKYFEGTFQEMFRSITTVLGDDRRTTNILYNNFDGEVLSLDNQRLSVSGVDLNDEATNMMQFQKSYAAACRLLTTIDSMLDKLINGTAI